MPDNEAQPFEDRNLDQEVPSLGQVLRRAREAQGLTLEQICAELRFEQHVLEALEDDRLDELGPAVFAKGYIKHYGQRLGLSYEDLVQRYHAAVGRQEVVIEPSRAIRLRDQRQITVWVIAALVLLFIGVVLFVWWINGAGESTALPGAVETSRPATGEAAGGALTAPSPAPRDAERVTERPEEPPPRNARSAEPDPARDAESAADGRFAPAADVARPAASVDNGAPQPAEGEVGLELVFTGDSWTEVRAGDGERLVYTLMRAGERRRAVGEAPLTVLLGNADGVRVTVDGEPFAIPAAARRGDLAEFTVGEPEN